MVSSPWRQNFKDLAYINTGQNTAERIKITTHSFTERQSGYTDRQAMEDLRIAQSYGSGIAIDRHSAQYYQRFYFVTSSTQHKRDKGR